MTHPTDDELEAMAVKLTDYAMDQLPLDAAAMLRACKGGNAAPEARAEKAEAERDALRDREKHFASVLSVADRGQYRNDWDAAIRRVVAERDALRELLSETAEYLFVAASEGSHERFDARLRVFRRARAALNREPDT